MVLNWLHKAVKLLSILINTLWTHRCSAFTKDLPVIKIRVAHLFSVLCSPIMCLYVLGPVLWFPHTNDGWVVCSGEKRGRKNAGNYLPFISDSRLPVTSFPVIQLPVAHAHAITSGTTSLHHLKCGLSCAYILLMSHKTKNKNQTKTNEKRRQCALDTTIRKQTQITLIRHEPSYKQLEVKTTQTSFVSGNHNTGPKT
jgi:hypothetical protein